jgi:hypothetical protein
VEQRAISKTQHTGTPVVVLPQIASVRDIGWLGGTARVKGGRVIELVREAFRYSSDQSKERRESDREGGREKRERDK